MSARDSSPVDPRVLLEAGLGELALGPTPAQVDALLQLARIVEGWARRINLTGHRTLDAVIRRLVLEAAALSSVIPPVASLADLGSGAGFPGFPLAILRPSCRLTLVEARERRHHVERAILRELRLENVTLELGRSESLPARAHAAVVAQAVARPARALPWMLRWAEPGGLVLLPGSDPPPEVPEVAGVSFQGLRRYRVPCGGPARTLWVGRVDSGRDS